MVRVSVILPLNHDRGFLAQAIASVKGQRYANTELIIAQGNGSSTENVNRGIRQSTGDYIVLIGEDDILPPTSVGDRVEGIGDHAWLHGDAFEFGDIGGRIYAPPTITLKGMLKTNPIHNLTTMFRRDVFEKYGMYDEFFYVMSDYEMSCRLLALDIFPIYLPKVVGYYRVHARQESSTKSNHDYIQKREAMREMIRTRYSYLD